MEITTEEYMSHTNADDGFCTSCQEFTDGGVEPDAENYICPLCDEHTVFGTEQSLLLGFINISE